MKRDRLFDDLSYSTGNVLLSRAVAHQVSSALESLTSVFGMGTGVTSPLLSPDILLSKMSCPRLVGTSSAPSKLNNNDFSSFSPSLRSSVRPISIGQLNTLLHLHLRPINVIVSHGSYPFGRRSFLVGGFALRCFQRLSPPYVATQLCLWQDNWCTSGMSIPVLSY